MTGWTARQRVETALLHQEPDRVPMDLTITIQPYLRLCEYLGETVDEPVKADSFGEVRPSIKVLKRLGVDITFVRLRAAAEPRLRPYESDGIFYDEWGVGRRKVTFTDGSVLSEVAVSPLKDATARDLEDYPWPDPQDPGRVAGLEEEARELYEGTDLAMMGRFGGTILELAGYLRGWEQWLMDLVAAPVFAGALLDKITSIQMGMDEAGICAAGRYLSIFKVSGEDLGMQDRALFSMKVWREVARPRLARRWLAARAALDKYAPNVKLLLHSDGAIRPFIPDLISLGIDALDPVQVHCTGMEPAALKRDFGNRLTFHGAIDTQQVLPFGSPDDVRRHVINTMQALAPGGGYILAPVHNVQPDVPPQNLVAMCQAVLERGIYPINQHQEM